MKEKRRVSLFDLLILFLILSLGVLLIGHALRHRQAPPEVGATLTLRVRNVLPRYADAIEGASELTLDGFSLSLISSERTAAKRPLPDGTGSFSSSLTCDLSLEYTAVGTLSEDGFSLGGRRALCPGMTVTLGAKDLVFEATVLRIEAETGDES